MPPVDVVVRDSLLKASIRLLSDGRPRTATQIADALRARGIAARAATVNAILRQDGKSAFRFDPAKLTYSLVANTTTGSTLRARIYQKLLAIMKDGRPRDPSTLSSMLTGYDIPVDRSTVFSILSSDGRDLFRFDPKTYTYCYLGLVEQHEPAGDAVTPDTGKQVTLGSAKARSAAPARVNGASTQATTKLSAPSTASASAPHIPQTALATDSPKVAPQLRQEPPRPHLTPLEQTRACISSLRIASPGGQGALTPLPEWARFFAHTGIYTAQQGDSNNRTVVAVAVPTRKYAAAFAALGIVTGRALQQEVKIDLEEHFRRICSLPKGTMLRYMKKERQLRAVFDGPDVVNGTPVIRVRIQNNSDARRYETRVTGTTDLLTKEQSIRVEVATGEETKKGLTSLVGGAGKRVDEKTLLSCYFNVLDVESYILRSRLECVLIGPRNLLECEICDTAIAIEDSNCGVQKGCLQDIVRVRDFLSDDQAYWSDFFVSRGSAPAMPDGDIPAVTVFDGAAGFLKWRDHWRSSNWLVLLDRTEYDFEQAAEQIRTEYVQNRTGDGDARMFPAPPAGVEAVIYQENRE